MHSHDIVWMTMGRKSGTHVKPEKLASTVSVVEYTCTLLLSRKSFADKAPSP